MLSIETQPKEAQRRTSYHRNVIITGLTSFFTDVSTEMIYPLLQAFISTIMKAHVAMLGPILGIIEGISESMASLLKVFSGYFSDKWQKRKLPTIIGYGLSSLSKGLFLFPFWFTVLGARVFDRIGKGVRTAPRDALISESTPKDQQGKAFGFQRSMDFAGASLGTVLSFFIIKYLFPNVDKMVSPSAFYPVFFIALIPAFLGVAVLFWVKDTVPKSNNGNCENSSKPRPTLSMKHYDRNLKLFFLAVFIFTLGNSSNQFLLLRSTKLGFSLSDVMLMYIACNFTTAILAFIFGKLSDKIGCKKPLLAGYIIYAAVYISFGLLTPQTNHLLWVLWPLYGVYYALTEGIEKAFVARIAPEGSKGTALGFFSTIVGIGLLPASLIAGFLFSLLPSAPFIFGGIMTGISAGVLIFYVREERPN